MGGPRCWAGLRRGYAWWAEPCGQARDLRPGYHAGTRQSRSPCERYGIGRHSGSVLAPARLPRRPGLSGTPKALPEDSGQMKWLCALFAARLPIPALLLSPWSGEEHLLTGESALPPHLTALAPILGGFSGTGLNRPRIFWTQPCFYKRTATNVDLTREQKLCALQLTRM